MANPDHVKLLKSGVDSWNKWIQDYFQGRQQQPPQPHAQEQGLLLDLSGASLQGMNLPGVEFSITDLRGADLSYSNLIGSNFGIRTVAFAFETYTFEDVVSRFPNITLMGMIGVKNSMLLNFSGALLTGINLTEAHLNSANFHSVDLTGADLTNSWLDNTTFTNTLLHSTKGLRSCQHTGPSTVDFSTLVRSPGLPLEFLRGCGVHQKLIEFLPSLLHDPLQFYSCFISYSTKDQEFADRLYADLQAKGVRCWFAPEDLKIGDRFRQRIDDAIRFHDKLLVVLSEASVSITWVEEEVESAFARERKEDKLVLFPVRVDDAVIKTNKAWVSTLQNMRQISDFSGWRDHNSYQKAFQRLLRDLQNEGRRATVI